MSLRSSASYSPTTTRKISQQQTTTFPAGTDLTAPTSPLSQTLFATPPPGSSSSQSISASQDRVRLTRKKKTKNESESERTKTTKTKTKTKAKAKATEATMATNTATVVVALEGETESETERRKKREQARSMQMAISTMEHDAVAGDTTSDAERLEGLKKEVMRKNKKKSEKKEKKEKKEKRKERKAREKAERERLEREFSSASSASSTASSSTPGSGSSSSSPSSSSSASSTTHSSSLLKHAQQHLQSAGGLPQPTVTSGSVNQALVRVLSSPATLSGTPEESELINLPYGGGGAAAAVKPKTGFSLKSSSSSAEMLNMISREGISATPADGASDCASDGRTAKTTKTSKAKTKTKTKAAAVKEESESDGEPAVQQQQRSNSARRLRIVRSDEVPADLITRCNSTNKKPSTAPDLPDPAEGSDKPVKKQLHTRLLEREKRKRADSVKRVAVTWDDFVLDEADEENVNILSTPSMIASASSPNVPTATALTAKSQASSPSLAKSTAATMTRSQSCSPSTGRRVHKRSGSSGGSSSGSGGSGVRKRGGDGSPGPVYTSEDEDEDDDEYGNDNGDDDEADDEFSQSGAAPGMPTFRAATFAKIVEKLVLFAAIKQGTIEDDFAFDWNSIRQEAISQLSPRSEEEMIMRDREDHERRAREDRERRESEKRSQARERDREKEKRELREKEKRKEVEREKEKRELRERQVRRFHSGDQPPKRLLSGDIEPPPLAVTAATLTRNNADKKAKATDKPDKQPTAAIDRVKKQSEHRRGKSSEDSMAISEAEMKLLADNVLEKRQQQIEQRNAAGSRDGKGAVGVLGSPPPATAANRRLSKQLSPATESEIEKSRDKLMFEQAMAIMRLEDAARSNKSSRGKEKGKGKESPTTTTARSPSPSPHSSPGYPPRHLLSGGSIPSPTSSRKSPLNSSEGAKEKGSSKSYDDFAEQKRKEEQQQRKERQQESNLKRDRKPNPDGDGDAKSGKKTKETKTKTKKEKKTKTKTKTKTKGEEKKVKVKTETPEEDPTALMMFDWDSIKEEAMVSLPRTQSRDKNPTRIGDAATGEEEEEDESSVAHRTGTLRYMPAGITRPALHSSVSFPSPSSSPSAAPPTFSFSSASPSSPTSPKAGAEAKKRPTLHNMLAADADDAESLTGDKDDSKKTKTTPVPPMKRSSTSPGLDLKRGGTGTTRGDASQSTRDEPTDEASPRVAVTRRRKASHHHSLERSPVSPISRRPGGKLDESDDDDGNADDGMLRRHKILRERTKRVINDSREADSSAGGRQQQYSIGSYLSPGDTDARRARRPRIANVTPIRRRPTTPYSITSNAREQPTMVEAFILSFKSIFTPRDLCQALIKRYTTAPPRPADTNKIQEGVVSVLEQWINLQVMDFYEDSEVLRLFKASPLKKEHREGLLLLLEQKRSQLRQERFQELAASSSISASPVRQSLDRPLLYRASGQSASQIYTPRAEPDRRAGSPPHRPDPRRASRDVGTTSSAYGFPESSNRLFLSQSISLSFSTKNPNNKCPWLRIKSSDIAQQMALVEHRLLRAVPNKEWLNANWTRKAKELLAPNILALSCHFNIMSNWVTFEVLSESRNDTRVKLIQKFARIAVKCRQLNNFNGLLEILAGLGNVAVTRLTKTWKDVDPETRRVLKQLDELMSPTHNRRNYRRLEAEAVPPCVPYLGVSLGDLFFIESNEMEISGLVNFEKLEMIGKVLYTLMLFQNVSYQFKPDPDLHQFLNAPPPVPDEDGLWAMSLSLQPLEGA